MRAGFVLEPFDNHTGHEDEELVRHAHALMGELIGKYGCYQAARYAMNLAGAFVAHGLTHHADESAEAGFDSIGVRAGAVGSFMRMIDYYVKNQQKGKPLAAHDGNCEHLK